MNTFKKLLRFSSLKFSIKEQTLFAKRLSFLVEAGVPMIECLTIIRTQSTSQSKKAALNAVIDDVNNGQYLSLSLRKQGNLFGDFAINLIRVGEESGILSKNLAYLADELEKQDALRRKVVGALIYPTVITVLTLGITSVLTMYIFPKILPVFSSLHVVLPLSTRILIVISSFMQHYGLCVLALIVAVGIGLRIVIKKFTHVRYLLDRTLLYTPIFGGMMKSYYLANFCRTLGLLLASGVQLTDALAMLIETSSNLAYKKVYEDILQGVIKGETIAQSLAIAPELFPDMLTHMVVVGERTGNLSKSLLYLSEFYEAEVEERTKNLSSAIEPLLMVIMGILVGFIAVSIITPIYEITQSLHG
jgi:type IV pilus assembly protein PilC